MTDDREKQKPVTRNPQRGARNPQPSERSTTISSFLVMDVLDSAKTLEAGGRDIIHFEMGEPDFNTPKVICEAGIRAIQEGKTKYTHSLGVPELRTEICRHYHREYRVETGSGGDGKNEAGV